MKPRRSWAGLLAGLLAAPVLAAPMGFKDSWMTMQDASPNWRESIFNYAFTARDAIGPEALWMRSDDRILTRTMVGANYTRRLHRWNLPEAQANVWFIGGIGALQGNDLAGTRTMVSPGIQVDYETRRVYTSALARLYRASGVNHDYAAVRAGFSFYETDYDEMQPWLIVEARRSRGLSDETELTPMLRLVHKRYFVELGVSNARQARLSLMYIF